jgi:hypothetical protein
MVGRMTLHAQKRIAERHIPPRAARAVHLFAATRAGFNEWVVRCEQRVDHALLCTAIIINGEVVTVLAPDQQDFRQAKNRKQITITA